MNILNFSHPFTEKQKEELASLLSVEINELIITKIPVQINQDEGSIYWNVLQLIPTMKDEHIYVMLPGLSIVAGLLVAFLYKEFPHISLIRLKPVTGIVTTFSVAEIIQIK